MSEPALLLFDDAVSRAFRPFSLTRPGGEFLFGALTLRERAERFWGVACVGHGAHQALVGFSEEGAPPVLDENGPEPQGTRILQLSRFAPGGSAPPLPDGPATLVWQGRIVGWKLPPGVPSPETESLLDPIPLAGAERVEVEGVLLESPWDMMSRNADQLRTDIPQFFPGYAATEVEGCHILGNGLLSLGRDVEVEPGSVFDLREGPIRLSDGVRVQAHTRLAGPAFIGRDSALLGGVFSHLSAGPVCKLRGEIQSSLILGFSNKAHDGFLGHAYLGKWVNLGALTTNSDLKNNYGSVRIGTPEGPVETGLMKVGCFLGDHVRTGIGTLLNTGTMVGAGSNLFGGTMPPKYVPPFSWGEGSALTAFRLESFLELAQRAMKRRGIELDSETESLLRRAWEDTRGEREA